MKKSRSEIIRNLLILVSVAILLSCSQGPPSKNGLLPRLPENGNSSPNAPGNGSSNSNISVPPPPVPPNKPPEHIAPENCECELPDCSRQICTFSLEGYESGQYNYHTNEFDQFIKKIVSFIEETELTRGCEILAITSWGYADALVLKPKALRWSDVPEFCRPPSNQSAYLTNEDLAKTRECLIKNVISSHLGGSIDITAKNWKSDWEAYSHPGQIGPEFRKVVIKVERLGTCP